MGARLYDPELGRFIQADDFVEPEATQGLNRYSYVLNNPLSATDPTGNFSLRQALAVVVAVVAVILQQYWALKGIAAFGLATAAGFVSGAIATGTLKGALWGAVSAAAFFGIGSYFQNVAGVNAEAVKNGGKAMNLMKSGLTSGQTLAKIAAHAGAGGTLNVLQGGKFGHGFVAAGFTEALSPAVGQFGDRNNFGTILAKTATSAAIGGTASVLSGGSFANGAKTGAFQQLFNHTAHEIAVQKMRDKVAEIALSMEDDESYALDTAKGNFGPGAWKCNKFVFDVLNLAGISAPMMPGGKWPILANDWANTNFKIKGWIFVTDPQAGDVAAVPRSGQSGHVGFYISDNWGSDVMAANRAGVGWSASHHRNEWVNWMADAAGDTVYRRYVGVKGKGK